MPVVRLARTSAHDHTWTQRVSMSWHSALRFWGALRVDPLVPTPFNREELLMAVGAAIS